MLLHRLQQLPEGVGEELHAFDEQLVGDVLHGDPDLGERGHGVSGGLHIFHEACARPPVVAKRVEGRRRDRVDGIGPDQLLDVDDVAVVGVLGSRACPEQPLRLGALGGQGLPALPAEELLVALIGQLGVGNRDLADQAAQQACLVRVRRRLQPRRDERIDRGIDPADEETGDAGNSLQVAAACGILLQACNVGFRHPLVRVLSKQQCHIDVDPLGDELVDSGNPLRRRGDFDHQIVAPYGPPQSPGFVERGRRVVREERRDLQAHVPVTPRRLVVHGAERIGGVLNILDREPLVERLCIQRPHVGPLENRAVIGASGNGLLENCRIRGHTAQAVLIDQAAQLTTGDQAAADVVEPHRLAEDLQRAQRVFQRGHLGEAAPMPRLVGEASVQERANQLAGELDADDTTAEHQHVHVVVLDALVRRVGVMAQSGANPGNPVRGHRCAHAAPAEQDAALGPVLAQGSTDGLRIVGIVHRIGAVGAQVEDLVMLRGQESLHRLLQRKSGMIRTYRDTHRSPRFRDLLLRRRDDILGREAELLS